MKIAPRKKSANLLIMFVRYPKLGHVKTRMTQPAFSNQPLSPEMVLTLYEAFLADLLPRFKDEKTFDLLVRLGGNQEQERVHFQERFALKEPQLEAMPPSFQDLGALMETCFAQGFQAGYQHIVLMGSDAPQLTKNRIAQAFQALETVEVVIGPDKGGGMYLVGYGQPWGLMEEGIAWSQGTDCAEVKRRCQEKNLAYELLPEERDLDTSEDLQAWYHQSEANASAFQRECPHTFPLIEKWVETSHQRERE